MFSHQLPYYQYPLTSYTRQFPGSHFPMNPMVGQMYPNRPEGYPYTPYPFGFQQPTPFAHSISNNIYHLLDDPLHPIYENNLVIPNYQWQNTLPPLQGNQPPTPNSPGSLILNSFKNQDGSVDFNKMFSAAGQLVGTLNQFSSLLKGVTSIFKT